MTAGLSNTREGNANLFARGEGEYDGVTFDSDFNYNFQGTPTLKGTTAYKGKDGSASFSTDTDFNERLNLATAGKFKGLGVDATANINKEGLSNYSVGAKAGPLSGRVTGDSENNTNIGLNLKGQKNI